MSQGGGQGVRRMVVWWNVGGGRRQEPLPHAQQCGDLVQALQHEHSQLSRSGKVVL